MDISYELHFDNMSWLEVDAPPTKLTPGDQAMIPVRFMPREMKAYAKTLQFEVLYFISSMQPYRFKLAEAPQSSVCCLNHKSLERVSSLFRRRRRY
jgi:hypothetical protein